MNHHQWQNKGPFLTLESQKKYEEIFCNIQPVIFEWIKKSNFQFI